MRPFCALWLVGLSIAGSGCALVEDSTHNMVVAVKTPFEIHREKSRNEEWAQAAWRTVMMKDGPCAHSSDFACGFKEGFAEYLFRGGDGEPPLVAPLRYRQFRYQNPNGYQAIQDWFAGYRRGAAAAHDSGARKWITSPSALQGELPPAPAHEVPAGLPYLLPPKHNDVLPLPPPQVFPKEISTPAQLGPANVGMVLPEGKSPPVLPEGKLPPTEPMANEEQPEAPKARIMGVRELPPALGPPMVRFTEISETPEMAAVEEPPAADSTRVKIKAITTVPPKD